MRILRLLCIVIVLFFYQINVSAQNYSRPDTWIKFNQKYVSFKVSKTGVYRITRNQLVAALNTFSTVNPKNIQVFARGEEQYIYVKGEDDYSFDSNDYIELYCTKNDGLMDTVMYEKPVFQNNPHYSQINDAVQYFVTWENTPIEKKRYERSLSNDYTSYPEQSDIKVYDFYDYHGAFYWGQRIASYSSGKGWFDAQTFALGAPVSKSFPLAHRRSASNLKVHYSVCGVPSSKVSSDLQHKVKIAFRNQFYTEDNYVGYQGAKQTFDIASDSILSDELSLKFEAFAGETYVPDRNAVAYVGLEYGHDRVLVPAEQLDFKVNISAKSHLKFTNLEDNQPVLYNSSTGKRIAAKVEGGNAYFVLPEGDNQAYHLSSDASFLQATEFKRVSFQNFTNLTESPDYLLIYHSKLKASAQRYAAQRESKGHKVLMADIDDLYNQFAYGVEKHPIAIRNFVKYINDKYGKPNNLFLIGKGFSSAAIRNNPAVFAQCLIPTMGNPPSDLLICANMYGSKLTSYVPIGRLAATSDEDVDNYLEKVKAYGRDDAELWRKRVVHFGGGKTTQEQTMFKNYLTEYKRIYEDTLIGGSVTSFLKTSSDPIQISMSDSVENLINSGVSQMTFFGHGSSSGFDQNIDKPSKYNNTGRYPIIVANSCLSGNIYGGGRGVSEQWVLIKDKGAIAFLAASDLGYTSELYKLSKGFYQSLTYKRYGKSLGEIVNEAYRIYSGGLVSNYIKKTIYDNTLHGDPSLIVHPYTKADLRIKASGISLEPKPLTNNVDSFVVSIQFQNLTKAVSDTFYVSVERTLPNGEKEVYQVLNTECKYEQNNSLKIPCNPSKSVGMNHLKVRLDSYSQIDEISELNNTAEISFMVHSGDLLPIWPYDFAVVDKSKQRLIASSGDPFVGEFDAVFQVDTNDSFSSPFLKVNEMHTSGGLTIWELPFELTDSMVYFWRVSRVGSNRWREQSFRYIEGQKGWSQAHFHQFKNDDFQFIDYKKEEGKYEFITTPKKVRCTTIGSVPVWRLSEVGFWLDAFGDNQSCSAAPAFNVVVIDPLNMEPWKSDRQNYGHRDYPKCFSRHRPDLYFQFTSTSEAQMNGMVDLLNDVPDNHYVLIYSIWNGNFKNQPEALKTAIEALNPASQFRTIDDNIPYILLAQKGNISFAEELVGDSITAVLTLEKNLKSNFDRGYISTKTIGPALKWQAFYWDYKEKTSDKIAKVKMTAIANDHSEYLVFESIGKDSLAILNLDNYVDAGKYPYIKLSFYTEDELTKKAAQIDSWSLLYEQVPETAIDLSAPYYMSKDTLEQGEDLYFAISTQNISLTDMDSLLVSFYVKDSENNIFTVKEKKLRPHPAGDILTDTVIFNTINVKGENSIWVEFNALNKARAIYGQSEQYHFNNIATRYFYVKQDAINPLLNVTFDGQHIMDGDIVSAQPQILIELQDDNKYLALESPDLLSVYLKKEGSENEIKIMEFDSLMRKQLLWTPAHLPQNKASMLFTPNHLDDGIYTLRVGATDVTNNESGKYDYRISFEVVNKSTITEVLNYPNPFSTSTQFVFTLTGRTVPDEITIQIFTVSGKVVKEIRLTELSDLHIGRNITDYRWDGKDEYGDNLANGVYFYRVMVKKDGKRVEKRSNEASKFFKEDIGKMYILR